MQLNDLSGQTMRILWGDITMIKLDNAADGEMDDVVVIKSPFSEHMLRINDKKFFVKLL